ncbi:hypothetical protein [Streptomyces sp. NPDC087297]|uniref:hypothetical protein n=1 Tax=Streptomyces sp. NPDC087297 TaxID=3365778 RepID=UPI0038198957
MSTSKPRKPRKRTREIREHARTSGAQYTAALRANDHTREPGAPKPEEPWAEPSVQTVRRVAAFVRQRCEETAAQCEDQRVQAVLRQVLPELVEKDLTARLFRHMASVATAAENLLVEALDPEESIYGWPDEEDQATSEEMRGYWRSLLDLAYQHRDHPDLPSKVRGVLADWTPTHEGTVAQVVTRPI